MQSVRIDISAKTVFTTTALLALLWLSFLLKDIIIIVFLAYILMSAFNPLVDYFEKRKIPRWLSAASIIFSILGLFIFTFASLAPPLVEQTKQFVLNLPVFMQKVVEMLPLLKDLFKVSETDLLSLIQNLATQFSRELVATPVGVARLGASFLERVFALITFVFVSFYLLVEHRKMKAGLMFFVPKKNRARYQRLVEDVEEKLGNWLRGELVLMLVIGTATFFALTLVGVPFALPLAVLAGILEIVPIIGPIISVIPTIFVAASLSPVYVAAVIVIYTIIQQLESNFIVPAVMKQAVGLDPLVILIALMAGTRLLGPIGALLSVPTTVVFATLTKELFEAK